MAFLRAAAAGTYLACLRDALSLRRSMGPEVLRANLGAHTFEIINVLFPIYVVELLLALIRAPALVTLPVSIAIALFLNPVPEMIGRVRAGGVELLLAHRQPPVVVTGVPVTSATLIVRVAVLRSPSPSLTV